MVRTEGLALVYVAVGVSRDTSQVYSSWRSIQLGGAARSDWYAAGKVKSVIARMN